MLIRKPQVISEGWGGIRTPCTLPLDPPLSWGMEKERFPSFFSKTTLGRNFFSLADFYSIFLDIWQNLVPDGCYGY